MAKVISEVAQKFGPLGVHAVYGEPVQLDGVTIVPVAATAFGFGGGGGGEDSDGNEAGGGGGGGWAVPVGAYVRDSEGVTFRPNPILLLALAVPFVWATGHAWARIIRALKR